MRTTVLFIDDDPAALEVWSERLSQCSATYSTLTATDIRAGLDLYRSQKVDCVVLDLDMPDGSGFEVMLSLIPDRRRPSIAVVVLTRLPYTNIHEMAMHNGAQACLVKQHSSANDLHTSVQNAIASIAGIS
jgi:CheY-like chemotaxis protein